MAASDDIDKAIAGLSDWRGERMAALRKLVNDADPRLSEDWKWGTPVWTYKGNVCAIAAFKEHVKVNFFKGARLDDPKSLFNAGLDAQDSRSIDITESDAIDEPALQDLIRAAASQNEKKT